MCCCFALCSLLLCFDLLCYVLLCCVKLCYVSLRLRCMQACMCTCIRMWWWWWWYVYMKKYIFVDMILKYSINLETMFCPWSSVFSIFSTWFFFGGAPQHPKASLHERWSGGTPRSSGQAAARAWPCRENPTGNHGCEFRKADGRRLHEQDRTVRLLGQVDFFSKLGNPHVNGRMVCLRWFAHNVKIKFT